MDGARAARALSAPVRRRGRLQLRPGVGHDHGSLGAAQGRPPGVHAPRPVGSRHGELVLHGETIAVDCYTMRDRSWQIAGPKERPRPSGAARSTTAGWRPRPMPARRSSARSGSCSTATSARSSRARSDASVTATTATSAGSSSPPATKTAATSRPSATRSVGLIAPVPNTHVVSVNSLMDYRINGIQAWGDDQDSWGARHLGGDAAQADGAGRPSPHAAEQRNEV